MAKRKKGSAAEPALTKAAVGESEAAGAGDKFAELGQENLAALWRANTALSEAFEAINDQVIGYVRSSFATAASTATALLGARTFDDVFQLNADLAKANMVG